MSALFLLVACSGPPPQGDTSSTPSGDAATVPLGGACPLAERVGGFEVSVNDLYSTIGGAVADGVLPISVLTPVASAGECTLLRRENPSCVPTCEPGQTCDFDGTCIDYPDNLDLGHVRIEGLEDPVDMTADPVGNTYFDTTLSHPVFMPDAYIELTTESGLTLHGVGVEPLVPTSTGWIIGVDPLVVSWAPPTGLGRSTVQVRLTIDQHGLTPLSLVCEAVDDGELTVDPTLVTTLREAGVTGYPNGRLSRRSLDRATLGSGCADLAVSFELLPEVSVEGHTPCDSHDDCPRGQLCNFVLETCE